MRSFATVAACVLLVVCAALAAPSVKLPKRMTAPKNAQFTGELLYNNLAHSQRTLPLGADASLLAADSIDDYTLLGAHAKHPASLVIVPEELAPEDASGELVDKSFPLMQMSLTLSTAVVMPGVSEQMKEALYMEAVHEVNVPSRMTLSVMQPALAKCGVALSEGILDGTFRLEGVDFSAESARGVLYAPVLACLEKFDHQVTVVDLRSTYAYAKEIFASEPAKIKAVEKMIRAVVEFLGSETSSFVVASDEDFFAQQDTPSYDFEVVSPRLTASLSKSANEKVSSTSTPIFQITLWFVIFIVIVVAIFTLLTCGVGIDIEKDTLLYQTTALRGQPVL